jgi:serine/threonine protein kinase/predicted Zn-dependent protease
MAQTDALGRTWEGASSPALARLARRFEADWKAAGPTGHRPDPLRYLPDDPAERPSAWLALLRAEMTLRWDERESVLVESYRDRYPDLDDQVVVALLYEEYCLREESGITPDPAEYDRRFPDLSSRLRRVLEIHDLVGGSASVPPTTSLGGLGGAPSGPEFPVAGETIGGFWLVEEIGQGSFSRVFRGRERQLGDRPVALKVARSGSREPETLARLQHTHIVPVHSYQIDKATGLHLLCMPYFGRVTLAMILADPMLAGADGGADLLAVLDRLEAGVERGTPGAGGSSAARRALESRSYAGAIAWWGARLAEALQHAHDRGVLHRDLKPSNVLVTADGMPMLLDFNLAQSRLREGEEGSPGKLGGTLAYMAPEHLEALADGLDDGGDSRADIYSLGVVLFEALSGRRPFGAPKEARSVPEALLRTAEERRATPPDLLREGEPVSPALEAILKRCLAPEPAGRYASAADLAEDLQAFADDGPLRHAREPQPARAARWVRRNRLRFALAAPLLAAAWLLAAGYHARELELTDIRSEIEAILSEGKRHEQRDELDEAIGSYSTIVRMAEGRRELNELKGQATQRMYLADEARDWRRKADQVIADTNHLGYRLLNFVHDGGRAGPAVATALDTFFVRRNPAWQDEPHMSHLREPQRERLFGAVEQVLFLWLAHETMNEGGPRADATEARAVGARAIGALPERDPRRGPWLALLARADGKAPPGAEPEQVDDLRSDAAWMAAPPAVRASAAFLWGIENRVAFMLEPDPDRKAAYQVRTARWLEEACREQPDHFWSRFCLAAYSLEMGNLDAAIEHADVVVALRPEDAWARFNRAEAYRRRDELGQARSDLEQALLHVPPDDPTDLPSRLRLNLALVRQAMGDARDAAELFRRVEAEAADHLFARAARLDGAMLDLARGRFAEAAAGLDRLVAEYPEFGPARWAKAELLARQGRFEAARAELDTLFATLENGRPPNPDWLALRARVNLGLGHGEEALADAEQADAALATPQSRRLVLRALLAAGRAREIVADDPAEFDLLPMAGPALAADLRRAAEALRSPAGAGSRPAMLTRAVLLGAIGDAAALDEASRAIALIPSGSEPLLIRARLRERSGDLAGALADIDRGLVLEPSEPRLWALRGAVQVALGEPVQGLADADRALELGLDSTAIRATRARAEFALNRTRTALAEWSLALSLDPSDPMLRLERARVLWSLPHASLARQDLEKAAAGAIDRPDLSLAVGLSHLLLDGQNPSRRERGLALIHLAVGWPPGAAAPAAEPPAPDASNLSRR